LHGLLPTLRKRLDSAHSADFTMFMFNRISSWCDCFLWLLKLFKTDSKGIQKKQDTNEDLESPNSSAETDQLQNFPKKEKGENKSAFGVSSANISQVTTVEIVHEQDIGSKKKPSNRKSSVDQPENFPKKEKGENGSALEVSANLSSVTAVDEKERGLNKKTEPANRQSTKDQPEKSSTSEPPNLLSICEVNCAALVSPAHAKTFFHNLQSNSQPNLEPQLTTFIQEFSPVVKEFDKLIHSLNNELDAKRCVEPTDFENILSHWEIIMYSRTEHLNDEWKPLRNKVMEYIQKEFREANKEIWTQESELAQKVKDHILDFIKKNPTTKVEKLPMAFEQCLNTKDHSHIKFYESQLRCLEQELKNKL